MEEPNVSITEIKGSLYELLTKSNKFCTELAEEQKDIAQVLVVNPDRGKDIFLTLMGLQIVTEGEEEFIAVHNSTKALVDETKSKIIELFKLIELAIQFSEIEKVEEGLKNQIDSRFRISHLEDAMSLVNGRPIIPDLN